MEDCAGNEQNKQGSVNDWEDFDHAPMEAMGVFECVNYVDPREFAFMKIYMQSVPDSHNIPILYE